MKFATVEEFKKTLESREYEKIVEEYLFSKDAYVFRNNPSDYDQLAEHLCASLSIDRQNITVVGSAKTGFSLSPFKLFRPFSDRSDIDVIVVDPAAFDRVWNMLLRWHYPLRRMRLSPDEWDWLRGLKESLYWGWLTPAKLQVGGWTLPSKLAQLRDIRREWFNAFQGLGRYGFFAGREVNGRLYRTWDHARAYHADGLRVITEEKGNM